MMHVDVFGHHLSDYWCSFKYPIRYVVMRTEHQTLVIYIANTANGTLMEIYFL